MDCSLPGSPIPGILQARTLEWVALSFSNAWKWKVKVMSFSHVRLLATPGLQPTKLLHPWDFPGKSTGVGCHCFLWKYYATKLYLRNLEKEGAALVAQTVKSLPTMQETLVRSLGQEDHLEKEMATHSSLLAWKIPRVDKPGGLQSMESHRIRDNWDTNTFTFTEDQRVGCESDTFK